MNMDQTVSMGGREQDVGEHMAIKFDDPRTGPNDRRGSWCLNCTHYVLWNLTSL